MDSKFLPLFSSGLDDAGGTGTSTAAGSISLSRLSLLLRTTGDASSFSDLLVENDNCRVIGISFAGEVRPASKSSYTGGEFAMLLEPKRGLWAPFNSLALSD